MNKVYKVLRIIFLTLAILSMLFAFASKVVFAASSGGSGANDFYPWSVPLPIASDVGFSVNVPDSIKEYVVSDIEDGITGSDNGYHYTNIVVGALLASEYDSTNNRITFVYLRGAVVVQDWSFDPSPSSPSILCNLYYNQGYGYYIYDISTGSCASFRNRSSSPGSFSLTQGYQMPYNELLPTGASRLVVPKLTFIGNYPVWVRGGFLLYDGNVVFGAPTHSGSGDDTTIDDIEDNIDEADDSNLPGVDDSDPSDPTSTPAWLKKILTGLKNINKNIQGIGITINKTLNNIKNKITELAETVAEWCVNFWDNVRDFFSGLISDVARIKDTIVEWGTLPSEEDMADEWDDGIEMSGLSDIFSFWHDCKQLLGYVFDDPYDSYTPQTLNANIPASPVNIDRENWSLTRGSSSNSSLVLTVKVQGGTILNPNNPSTPGVTAPTKTFSANFDWYKQIKDDYLWFIVPWFYVTALYVFVKSFPGVLNGASPVLHFARHPEG